MEWKKAVIMVMAIVLLWGLVLPSWAQRGMGDASGVVQQGLRPETVALQGKVLRVVTGPCEMGTGRFEIGTHFILKTEQGQEQNIHLGPAQPVQAATALLSEGARVAVHAFRTEKMPAAHYNAISVTLGRQSIRLRDQNLRPIWAGQAPLNAYGSDMNWRMGRMQFGADVPSRIESNQRPGPRPRCCRDSSWKRMGRARGWGRRGCCQAVPSRFGRQWRAWR